MVRLSKDISADAVEASLHGCRCKSRHKTCAICPGKIATEMKIMVNEAVVLVRYANQTPFLVLTVAAGS